jgi:hypothetical protein
MDAIGRFLCKLGFPGIQSHIDAGSPAQAAFSLPAPVLPSTPSQSMIPGGGRRARRTKKKTAPSTPASGSVKKKKAFRGSPVADYKKSKRRKKPTDAQVPPSEETLAKRRAAVEKRKKTIASKPPKPILDKEHVEIVSLIGVSRFSSKRVYIKKVVAINSLEYYMELNEQSRRGLNPSIHPVYLPAATGV